MNQPDDLRWRPIFRELREHDAAGVPDFDHTSKRAADGASGRSWRRPAFGLALGLATAGAGIAGVWLFVSSQGSAPADRSTQWLAPQTHTNIEPLAALLNLPGRGARERAGFDASPGPRSRLLGDWE